MNDLMSFGLHRVWKKITIARANVRPGQKVLDIAGGTGDLAAAFAKARRFMSILLSSANGTVEVKRTISLAFFHESEYPEQCPP
jgi:ubiquinone/menaquinone biosynthesis C-methylase UbiE